MKSIIRKPVFIFLILTLALSAGIYYQIFTRGKDLGLGQVYLSLGLHWCPAVAALIASLVCYRSVKRLGWGLGRNKRLLWVYFLPLLYGILVYGPVWGFQLGDFNGEAAQSVLLNAVGLFRLLVMAVIGVGIPVLGEEIGWRGLLTPELAADFDFFDTSLYTGAVSLLWYTPWILSGNGVTDAPLWYNWLCYALLTLGLSFAYTWLRLKSDSLWAPFLLHAGHVFFITVLFDGLTIHNGLTFYFTTEFGAGLALVGVIIGLVFWRLGKGLDMKDVVSRINI